MTNIDKIIHIALTSPDVQEPEVGINEDTDMIALYNYIVSFGASYWVQDICKVSSVDIKELVKALDEHNIYCVL